MGKELISIIFTVTILALSLIGCGGNQDISMDQEMNYSNGVADESESIDIGHEEIEYLADDELKDGIRDLSSLDRRLMYTANISIEVVDKPGPLVDSVKSLVEESGGYIESTNQYQRNRQLITHEELQEVFMTIRISHDYYDEVLENIENMGMVVSKSTSVEDVTLQYSDIESTVRMYELEQKRLLDMLENESKDVSDMIEIEKRLSEVRIELEKYESAKRSLESKIEYDTIELQIIQVRRENRTVKDSFVGRIKVAFVKSIDGIIITSQTLILLVAYMLVPACIIGVIYYLFRLIKKRKNNK